MDETESAQVRSDARTAGIDGECFSARTADSIPATETKMGTLRGVGITTQSPLSSWNATETAGRRDIGEHSSVGRMAELAKRIETSAGTSSAWGRFAGQELSRLRTGFGRLLEGALHEVGCESPELLDHYRSEKSESGNRDLVLSYRLACLLAATLRNEQAQDVARVEIGCTAGKTEFACFIAEKSVGVTVHRDDNLFALCTNGGWQIASEESALDFANLRRAIELYGGQVRLEGVRTTGVKVSFPISL